MTHYIYAVSASVIAPPYCSYLKIGHAHEPSKRLLAHQIGSPIPLHFVALWGCQLRGTAVRMETACHRRFKQAWVHGEWHQVSVDEIEAFLTEMSKREGFMVWRADVPSLAVVSQLNEPVRHPDALDLVWGLSEISQVIGRTVRQTETALAKKELPGRKVNGRWVASRRKLIEHFEGEAA